MCPLFFLVVDVIEGDNGDKSEDDSTDVDVDADDDDDVDEGNDDDDDGVTFNSRGGGRGGAGGSLVGALRRRLEVAPLKDSADGGDNGSEAWWKRKARLSGGTHGGRWVEAEKGVAI